MQLLKIIEMLRLLDFPTVYLLLFTVCWLLVLILFALILKSKNRIVYWILAVIPLINFAVFYLINYTKGAPATGFVRYGPCLLAALGYALAGIVLARSDKKAKPVVISGVLAVLMSVFTVAYILINGTAYHYCNFSHLGYERSMASLIDELEKNYVLRDYKEIDFEQLRAEYIPLAAEAEKNGDEAAFAEAVANLCYEFHDGHLYIRFTDNTLRDAVRNRMAGNDYGFSMIRIESGEVIAFLADETSEAYLNGIHEGTVITGWNGTDINEAVAGVRCVSSGAPMRAYPIESNEDIMRPLFLAGQGGDTVNVRFIDDETGMEKEITVNSIGSYYGRLRAATDPLTHKRCDEFGYAEMLDGHCGYLCIPGERYDTLRDAAASLNDEYPAVRELLISRIEGLKAQGMDRLVIDLRDNDGGLDVITQEVAALFTDKEMKTHAGFYNGSGFEKSKYWTWTVENDGRYSDIPVVVLVNAGCASCGDVLAYHLSECPNVTMMGITTTWGSAQCTGGECLMSNGHIEVRYPIVATLDDSGSVFIDAGSDRISAIPLDVKIPVNPMSIFFIYDLGGDYELEYAVNYLYTLDGN